MTFVAGTPLSAADLNDALASDSPTNFTTNTPAGSGWIRFLLGGALVEINWNASGTIPATTSQTLDYTIPAVYRPANLVALAGAAGATGNRLAAGSAAPDGTLIAYNGHTASAVVHLHGIYKPA